MELKVLRGLLRWALVWLAAWASTFAQASDGDDTLLRKAQQASVGPTAPPRQNVTSFAPALRCMDGVMRTYGASGETVVIEDIPDHTKKVSVGAKDMFVSATSQMTRSSRAIRLITYDGGSDAYFQKRRDEILGKAGVAYLVQGSISQFDETTLRKQRDGAICLGPLCIGGAESDSFSGLSLDLNMIETEGMTLVPGVTSKNFVLIRRKGRGFDGDLSLQKFGVQYNFTFTSSDGQGQALRSLVELSVIELYGRMLRVPYWSCLGLTEDDPGVSAEIEDWWETLRGDIAQLLVYFQTQMQARGLYKGEVNGQLSDELKRAIRAYKVTMGLADDLNLDASFFRRYLAANHAELQPVAVAKLAEITVAEGPVAATPAPEPSAGPAVLVEGRKGANYVYRRGEAVEVEVSLSRNGHLYCYLIDENRQVVQFFPNPGQPSSSMQGGVRVLFPGRFPFRLSASTKGMTETVACFAAAKDLGPQAVSVTPTVRDATTLREAISQRAGHAVEMGIFDVKVQ